MNKLTQQKQGFTIIEVVLVLAIAALLMLMVFIAYPALQRSQRDTARKNDASSIASQVGAYESNNNGALPPVDGGAGANPFTTSYLSKLNRITTITVTASAALPNPVPAPDKAAILEGYTCPGASASGKPVAVVYGVEAGGANATGCIQAQ